MHGVRLRTIVTILLLAAVVGGCKSSIVAPRTGEYFQATRMGPGCCMCLYGGLFLGGAMLASEGDCPVLGVPICIIGAPIAAAGFVADECVLSPLVDILCLPYDLCQPNHGFYIRIVDEEGNPLPGVAIEGTVDHGFHMYADISGKTDAAGEFYVNRLSFEDGWFMAHKNDRPDWWKSRWVTLEGVKPGPDGRYVFTFTMSKKTPGGWKAKTDGERMDLIMNVLHGKWSADAESREWIRNEYGSTTADDRSKHWIELRASGAAHRCDYDKIVLRHEEPKDQDCFWTLERNDEVHKVYGGPATWTWRARLSWRYEDSSNTYSREYYLGEDEKGIYLSPGPFSSGYEKHDGKAILKFRKVDRENPRL